MPIKRQDFIIQGMQRDTSEHIFDPKFAYENQNMRITTNPNSSSEHTGDLLAMTNERGNKYTPIEGLEGNNMIGVPIGQCLINKQWVVFTTDRPLNVTISEETLEAISGTEITVTSTESNIANLLVASNSRIYKLWLNDSKMFGELLYEGNLGFDYTHPIEALPYYENEQIQKVYWTDGLNQPRFINIAEIAEKRAKWTDTSFDFVATIDLLDTRIEIEESDTGGKFPAGVIQWFFTYSRQFGQETSIFASTGLYELKYVNRGAAPDEMTSQSFNIKIYNCDPSFDYVNVYSVIRTSIDNVPIAKLVGTVPISIYRPYFNVEIPYIEITDNNLYGSAIDPQELLYKGGESITAYTIEQKDNTLFLGNYNLTRSYIPENISNIIKEESSKYFSFKTPDEGSSDELTSYQDLIKGKGYYHSYNKYRLGLQFQHITGKWSEVVWIGDYTCNETLALKWTGIGEEYKYAVPYGELTIGGTFKSAIKYIAELGYVKVRPLAVMPNVNERGFVAQGVLSNTLYFSQKDKYRYPDYLFRFINSDVKIRSANNVWDDRLWYNKKCIFNPSDTSLYYTCDEYGFAPLRNKDDSNLIYLSGDVYNLYSPDLEFNDSYKIVFDNKQMWMSMPKYISILFNAKSLNEITTSSISKPTVGHNSWISPAAKNVCYEYWNNKNVNDIYTYTVDYSMSEEAGSIHYEEQASSFGLYKDDNAHTYTGYSNNYAVCTTSDAKDLFTYDAKYPNRIPSTFSISRKEGHHYVGGYLWNDTFLNVVTRHSELTGTDIPNGASAFMQYFWDWVFPVSLWQASGSICNDPSDNPSSVLKSNKTLNYFNVLNEHKNIYNSNTVNVNVRTSYGIDVKKITDTSDPLLYSQRVNDILNWTDYYTAILFFNPKSSFTWNSGDRANRRYTYPRASLTPSLNEDNINLISQLPYDGVTEDKGSYKTRYAGFNWTTLRSLGAQGNEIFAKKSAVVKYNSTPHFIIQGSDIPDLFIPMEHIPICELRQTIPDNIFGGTTASAIQNNNFLIAGDSVNIVDSLNVPITENSHIKVKWTIGDVYYREYECLKTYPISFEDENCVTEVIKLPIETYYNLNGRYDTWKDNPTFSTSPANWNLMNPVYNQKDNFFVYHGLDLSVNSVNSFPNSFTWTLTKWSGSMIDKWTQITMASTMDVDGSKGEITKLIKFNDNLLCFQPRGLSQILYNEREQISTGSGVPIELANSGKVNGTRYITENTGCNNKWSVCKTESGLYWVDDENKQICAWNQQLVNLSDMLGFHSWINDVSELKVWNPLDFKSFVTYYDPYYESVMFIYKDRMLSYNTQLNCFDSFFSYGSVPYYAAFGGTAFTLSDKDSDGKDTYKVWEQHKGHYNYFYVHDVNIYKDGNILCKGMYDENGNPTGFGYEPYFTTLLVNPDMPYDKIFNNFDMRTDMWDRNNNLLEETYSHLEVWNEYQHNKSRLIRRVDIPKIHFPQSHSILQKKFRVWYGNIPRDTKTEGTRYYNRDRMRNTWLYFKLSKELINDDKDLDFPYILDSKHVIHHIGINYFI